MRETARLSARIFTSFTELLCRLKGRPDSEHEQAIIRVVIVALIFFYLMYLKTLGNNDSRIILEEIWVLGCYLALSCLYLVLIALRPTASLARRLVAMLTDIGVTLEDRPDGTIWRKE